MKTLSAPAVLALRSVARFTRTKTVSGALGPYKPVGWCAAVQTGNQAPSVCFDGFSFLPDTKVKENTIFRVASISKILAAAAVMSLVKRGMLSLDGDISEVLQMRIRKVITLRQLLTHTASLTDAGAYHHGAEAQNVPPLDRMIDASFLPYAPGARFHYSNLGAGVAGMAVEAAAGMLFDDFIRKEFFAPFVIDASFHPQRIRDRERLANCYRVPGSLLSYDARQIAVTPLDEKPDPSLHYYVPAGKLMISAPDLLSVLQNVSNTLPELFVAQNYIGSVRCAAGRGLGVAYMPRGILSKDEYWGHQGVAYGALNEAWMCRDTGTFAVLLTNGVRLSAFCPLYRAGQAGMRALIGAA